jgi:DNA-directed RNA polymerase alpha subunit
MKKHLTLDALYLSGRSMRALKMPLHYLGRRVKPITTVRQLRARTPQQLLSLKGIGRRSLAEIQMALDSVGDFR